MKLQVARLAIVVAALAAACAFRAQAEPPAHIVVLLSEGTGFPFDDPKFTKTPQIASFRLAGRAFDNAFAADPSWAETTRAILGGRDGHRLLSTLRTRGYETISVGGPPGRGFDRAIPAKTGVGKATATALASGKAPKFVLASLDLRNEAAATTIPVPAVPLTFPAIAVSDRAPLDAAGFSVTPPPRADADRAQLAGRRAAAFRKLDTELGELLAGLERAGLTGSTAIVLVSAGPAPAPERSAPPRPDLLFEDWLRGFIVVRSPGLPRPGVPATGVATMADLAPTLAALAGARLVAADTVSLEPALADPGATTRGSLLHTAPREPPRIGRSVRTADHRFTQWPDGSEELFDERADPREWRNLAENPAHAATRAALARRIVAPPPPSAATPARPSSARRPNVLFIIADDLTAQYAQFGVAVKTPNLDRLKARGRVFERAYAPAPFCTPSRAAFLSGMSPARLELQTENAFGEIFTAKTPLIQEQFRTNGYFTASVGKVWDSQPGEKRGWDLNEWQPALPAGAVEAPAKLLPGMPVEAGPTTNPDEVEGDGRRARFAAKVLAEKRDKPLFLALGFVRPHVAWVAPRKYFDMYPPESIRFSGAPPDDTADIPAIAIRNRAPALPGLKLAGREPGGFSNDPAEARRGIAAYLACVTFMDAQLGVVLDTLDREDLWKNTIVVLAGDNGHHFGDHGGLWRKNTLFEESLRVPLVIAAPGLARPGAPTTALADLIDIYPTLVDLTGIARPGTLDGRSLTPVLSDPAASVQDSVIQYRPNDVSRRAFSLRTARHRYTLWPDGAEELYDLTTDPAGRRDLSKIQATAATRASLHKQLEGLVKP